MNVLDLPFIRYLGLEMSDIGELSLRVSDQHKNHLGTVHATVLYGIAEACSGQAMIDALIDPYPNALVVIRNGTIKYRSAARGDISARVKKTDPLPDNLLVRLKEKGAAKCQVEVETRSGNELVAIASFDFFIKTG